MLTIILTSLLVSLLFAPLGCLVLWHRYIYFGDGLSHASLLAGSISIASGLPLLYSGILVSLIFATTIFKLKSNSESNAVINLVSSLMLAISIIMSYLFAAKININHLLFGDIIAAQTSDLIVLLLMLVMALIFISYNYQALILIALNKDLAKVQGIKVNLLELAFLIMLSLAVFASQKIIGTLLATSLLIIPAMTAQLAAKSPLQMILTATFLAILGNMMGLFISYHLDMPIAPAVILVEFSCYVIFYVRFKVWR